MKATPGSLEFNQLVISREKLQEEILALIPDFQTFCLNSGYDVIVPVENEGLSVLLPALKKDLEHPRIIPSSSLSSLKPGELNGKRVLIEDVSIYSGKTILKIRNQIRSNFQAKTVDFASIIVFRDMRSRLNFVYSKRLLLTQNQYDWAREAILDYLGGNVLHHHSDPPLWSLRFPRHKRGSFYEVLKELGAFYPLPDYGNDNSNWYHFSLDNIHLSNSKWLPPSIEVEEFIKIRLFVHKTEPKILVLPLFFPVINKETTSDLPSLLAYAGSFFPPEYQPILEFAAEVPRNPYLYFRWISTIGSMLLLCEFHERVLNFGIDLESNSPLMVGPVPNLRNYSCRTEVLNAFEHLMDTMLSNNRQNIKSTMHLPLFDANFSFPRVDKFNWFRETNDQGIEALLPERYLASRIGQVTLQMAVGPSESTGDIADRCLFTFPTLQHLAPNLTTYGMNRALDVLIDSGVVNSCIKTDEIGRIRRGYYVAGESGSLVQTLGYAYEQLTN